MLRIKQNEKMFRTHYTIDIEQKVFHSRSQKLGYFDTHFLIFHIRRKGAEQSGNRFARCVHSTATGKSLMQETLDWDRILIVQEIWDGDRTIVTEEEKIFFP